MSLAPVQGSRRSLIVDMDSLSCMSTPSRCCHSLPHNNPPMPVRLPFLYDFGFVVAEIIGAKKVVTYKAKEVMVALKSDKGTKGIFD